MRANRPRAAQHAYLHVLEVLSENAGLGHLVRGEHHLPMLGRRAPDMRFAMAEGSQVSLSSGGRGVSGFRKRAPGGGSAAQYNQLVQAKAEKNG